MAASISRTDTAAQTPDQSSYTFASMSFGDAAADRHIAVGIVSRASANRTISDVTIGGVTATPIVNERNPDGGNTTNMAIFIAEVPSGTSGNVVVDFTNTQIRCAITVWRIIGSTGVSPSNGFSTVSNPSTDLDIPAGGVACAISYTQANTDAVWTGLTEDTDADVEGTTSQYSSAHDEFATEQTDHQVQCSWSNNSLVGFAAAAFAPIPQTDFPVSVDVGLDASASAGIAAALHVAALASAGVSIIASRLLQLLIEAGAAASATVGLAFSKGVLVTAGIGAQAALSRAVGKVVAITTPLSVAIRKAITRTLTAVAEASASVTALRVFLVFVEAGVSAAATVARAARRLLFKAGVALGLTSVATGAQPQRGQVTKAGVSLDTNSTASTEHATRNEITETGPGIGRSTTLFE